jgi:cell division septum initiation protein DivIVA
MADDNPASPFPLVRRGYEPELVDRYVDETQAELHRLAAETRELNALVARLRRDAADRRPTDALHAWRIEVDALAEGARADIERIRRAAQEAADGTLGAANDKAAALVREAEERAAHVDRTSTARHEAAQQAASAERATADRVIADARRLLREVSQAVDAACADF